MQVVEVFYSLQGEGALTGMPSVFVRLAGCLIRCPWCDTRYAWDWDAGVQMEPRAIIDLIGQWDCRHVVITGGEPLLGQDGRAREGLVELTRRLEDRGYHLTIETSGQVFDRAVACDLMSISPKPGHLNIDALKDLLGHYRCQLKFIVPGVWDLDQIDGLVAGLGHVDRSMIWLMPLARDRAELLAIQDQVAQACLQRGWRFCQRLHILLWDGQTGR
ncbi:MAG: 7-carboxy-7-deazaguanine synthase QueE [Sedimentisphaerales bacterium]|nr:7-carboxy-7-deazaguanine synthase QueE [Sedimentisphaerales bacterium]